MHEQQKHENACKTCNEKVTTHHNGTCKRPQTCEQWKAYVTTKEANNPKFENANNCCRVGSPPLCKNGCYNLVANETFGST